MFKKIITVCCLSVISASLKAQVLIALLFGDKLNTEKLEFGLSVGANFSNISNSMAKTNTGFALGLYFNIKMSENFFLHPEVLPKSPFGGKDIPVYSLGDPNLDNAFKDGSIERKIKYISMPLLVRYRISGLFFAEAGPQVSLRTKVKDIFQQETTNGDLELTKMVSDEFTRFDLGAAAGLVLKLKQDKGMGIGIRYYQGFIDVMKTGNGSQKNNGFLFYISIPVGAGKSQSASNPAK